MTLATRYTKAHRLAEALLDAIVDEFTKVDVGLPALRFVSNGSIPFDTELLAVALNRIYGTSASGPPDEASLGERPHTHWRSAQFEVVLMRCAPVFDDNPLDAQPAINMRQLAASALRTMTDPLIMTQGILNAYQGGLFGAGVNLAFEDWAALGPEGALVGGRMMVRIGLL